MTTTKAPAPGTMGQRGQDYVAAWPTRIAQQIGLSPAYVAEALTRAGLSTREEQGNLGQTFLRGEPTPQIAALTPDTAKTLVAELRAISAEISETAKTHCHYCNLKLRTDGECPSCGNTEY
ncbi:hypothetical protein ACIPW9_36415 [Streptomyces sp. NPDC090052]|uniref:hypothetical protein n=1 Tax=Streptomyces sp. NPDC090052 TaxID=3365931 RepID=UPI0037FF8C5D